VASEQHEQSEVSCDGLLVADRRTTRVDKRRSVVLQRRSCWLEKGTRVVCSSIRRSAVDERGVQLDPSNRKLLLYRRAADTMKNYCTRTLVRTSGWPRVGGATAADEPGRTGPSAAAFAFLRLTLLHAQHMGSKRAIRTGQLDISISRDLVIGFSADIECAIS
jgi:hypothetical protein